MELRTDLKRVSPANRFETCLALLLCLLLHGIGAHFLCSRKLHRSEGSFKVLLHVLLSMRICWQHVKEYDSEQAVNKVTTLLSLLTLVVGMLTATNQVDEVSCWQ